FSREPGGIVLRDFAPRPLFHSYSTQLVTARRAIGHAGFASLATTARHLRDETQRQLVAPKLLKYRPSLRRDERDADSAGLTLSRLTVTRTWAWHLAIFLFSPKRRKKVVAVVAASRIQQPCRFLRDTDRWSATRPCRAGASSAIAESV